MSLEERPCVADIFSSFTRQLLSELAKVYQMLRPKLTFKKFAIHLTDVSEKFYYGSFVIVAVDSSKVK